MKKHGKVGKIYEVKATGEHVIRVISDWDVTVAVTYSRNLELNTAIPATNSDGLVYYRAVELRKVHSDMVKFKNVYSGEIFFAHGRRVIKAKDGGGYMLDPELDEDDVNQGEDGCFPPGFLCKLVTPRKVCV